MDGIAELRLLLDGQSHSRARETYARTVVADVTIQNRQALRAAALLVLDVGIVLIGESPDEPDDLPDPREEIVTSDAAAVQ